MHLTSAQIFFQDYWYFAVCLHEFFFSDVVAARIFFQAFFFARIFYLGIFTPPPGISNGPPLMIALIELSISFDFPLFCARNSGFRIDELRQTLAKWLSFPHERHDFPCAGQTCL
jgi:hypothetical protein